MGWKGLIRDSVMFIIGVSLLFNWMEIQTAAIVLIVTSLLFTVYAWWRYFKG
jgi:hypothetical protein